LVPLSGTDWTHWNTTSTGVNTYPKTLKEQSHHEYVRNK
jgi:hypothetical protein